MVQAGWIGSKRNWAAARLRHPHIVPLYDTGLDDGRHYIASAYIEGTTLADIIEPGGVESDRAAEIAVGSPYANPRPVDLAGGVVTKQT